MSIFDNNLLEFPFCGNSYSLPVQYNFGKYVAKHYTCNSV